MRESDIAIGFGCGFVGVIGHDPSWSHGVGWGWALCDRPSDGGGGGVSLAASNPSPIRPDLRQQGVVSSVI